MASGGRRAGEERRRAGEERRRAGDERSGPALTGGGPSQLGVVGSMRARDVSRPAEADLALAERVVQVSFRPRQRPAPAPGGPAGRPRRPAAGQAGGSGGSSPDAS